MESPPTRPLTGSRIELPYLLLLVLIAALTVGCATTYYNADFDAEALGANRSLDLFLLTNGASSDKVSYMSTIADYNTQEATLNALVMRARLIDNDGMLVEITEEIRDALRSMRQLHREKGVLDPAYFARQRDLFEQQFYQLVEAIKSLPAAG
jgi:hypothetical protein